jgi:hypothetical protein
VYLKGKKEKGDQKGGKGGEDRVGRVQMSEEWDYIRRRERSGKGETWEQADKRGGG